jgi:hypothetical protein
VLLSASLVSVWPSPALASTESAESITAGPTIGTTGIGGTIRVPLKNGVALRLTGGTATVGRTSSFQNRVIDVDVHLALDERIMVRTLGLTLEKMGRHGLGIVGGFYNNGNGIRAVSIPTDSTVTIKGTTYSQADAGKIFTDVRWNRFAPYLGVRIAPSKLGGAFLEMGGYYQGASQVQFSATGAIAANQSSFQPYYDDETRQLRGALAPVRVYPVVQIGFPLFRR